MGHFRIKTPWQTPPVRPSAMALDGVRSLRSSFTSCLVVLHATSTIHAGISSKELHLAWAVPMGALGRGPRAAATCGRAGAG